MLAALTGVLVGFAIGAERTIGALIAPMLGGTVLAGASWLTRWYSLADAMIGLVAFCVALQMGYLFASALRLRYRALVSQDSAADDANPSYGSLTPAGAPARRTFESDASD